MGVRASATDWRFPSPAPEATQAAARALADSIEEAARVLALSGELGAGKTHFVKGLAAGLGIDPELVSSPTFAIVQDYGALGRRRLVHVDLYRIESEAELEQTGFLDLLEPEIVLAVEWAERIPEALPADRLELRIERPANGRPGQRALRARATGPSSSSTLRRWGERTGELCAAERRGPA